MVRPAENCHSYFVLCKIILIPKCKIKITVQKAAEQYFSFLKEYFLLPRLPLWRKLILHMQECYLNE